LEWTPVFDVLFLWLAIANPFGFVAVNALQSYSFSYAAKRPLINAVMSFSLVSMCHAVSAIRHIIPNVVSDEVGQWNVLALSMSAVCFSTMAVHAQGPMIGVSLLAGLFLGILTALPSVCFAIVTKNKS
jgi:hypothetical protein